MTLFGVGGDKGRPMYFMDTDVINRTADIRDTDPTILPLC